MSVIVIEGSNGVGKSTIINELNNSYELSLRKSIPDWFRQYLEIARKCSPELQKKMYFIGHQANYFEMQKNNQQNYLVDRFVMTTIIRLNFELGKSATETIDEILKIKELSTITLVLRCSKNKIIERLNSRGDYFNEKFYNYENEIYSQLSTICDKIILIENENNIDDTIYQIIEILKLNGIELKGKVNERKI